MSSVWSIPRDSLSKSTSRSAQWKKKPPSNIPAQKSVDSVEYGHCGVGNGDFYNYIMGDTYHFDQGN
jgi:hypothetical protein